MYGISKTHLKHEDARLVLIDSLKRHNYSGNIAVSTHNIDKIESLYAKGADLVLFPFGDAAEMAVEKIISFK